MEYIRDHPPGMVIYLQQEGRGIGLANKIAAYALQVRRRPRAPTAGGAAGRLPAAPARLSPPTPTCRPRRRAGRVFAPRRASPPPVHPAPQEKGLDTVDANRALGLPDDCREYSAVRHILEVRELRGGSGWLRV